MTVFIIILGCFHRPIAKALQLFSSSQAVFVLWVAFYMYVLSVLRRI